MLGFVVVSLVIGADIVFDDQNYWGNNLFNITNITTDCINLSGDYQCAWPAGGGNPFDQSLNTTDNVTFANLNSGSGNFTDGTRSVDITNGVYGLNGTDGSSTFKILDVANNLGMIITGGAWTTKLGAQDDQQGFSTTDGTRTFTAADSINIVAAQATDGTRTVQLADGTYALEATIGAEGNYGAYYHDSVGNLAILMDAGNAMGNFQDIGGSTQVLLATPTHAISATGIILATTLTDGVASLTGGALTGIASIDGGGTINIEDNLDGTGFTYTAGTFTDGVASLTSGSLTSVKLGSLTSNGFVKTSGSDGTLSVDTNTYLQNVVEDGTPQLGGNLDAQSNNLVDVSNITLAGDTTNHKIYDNSTCVIITGDTSTLKIC